MLQSIRDHTQGWIAGVIISLLILSFALWGIHSYTGTGGTNDVIAKVNGQEITKRQVSYVYERLRRQLEAQAAANGAQLPVQAENAIKERALQSLIESEALKQSSINKGYRLSNRQIDGFLESLPEFQVNGRFSEEKFRQLLQANLYSPGDFLELIKTSLLIDQPRLGIMMSAFVLPSEVNQVIALVNQERNIQYLIIPESVVNKSQIVISNDKIKSYYDEHVESFRTPEQVSIDYIELNFNNLLATIHPTDDQLRKYYNENSSSFTESTSAQKNAADKPKILAFEKVKEQVKKAYTQQQAEEKLGELREKLASITYEHPESLEPAAKELGLKVQSTGLFTAQDSSNDKTTGVLINNPKIKSAAFSDDVLNKQNNSDVIQLNSERSIVLRVKTHSPAKILELETVKPQITEALMKAEQNLKAKQLAETIQQRLTQGTSPDQVAASQHLSWSQLGFTQRNNSKIDAAILATAFAMPQPTNNQRTFAVAKIPSGYSVIALAGVKEGIAGTNKEQTKAFATRIQSEAATLEYDLYKDSQLHDAKIKIEGA